MLLDEHGLTEVRKHQMDDYYITTQVMDDVLDNVNRKLSNYLTDLSGLVDQQDPASVSSKLGVVGLTGGLLGSN